MIKYIFGFVLITTFGILYEKYKQKFVPDEELGKISLIRQFLLNDTEHNGKPMLWIHTSRDINARNWKSFYSRNSDQLNQPYIISCVETIIKNCGDSFNICLINDDSFDKLLPSWEINLNKLGDPVKGHVRQLALSKIIYTYGGLLLPNSTIVLKDLKPVFDKALLKTTFFAVEGINKCSSADMIALFPMTNILGCKKKSPALKSYITFLERKIGTDYTDEGNFLGEDNKFLYQLYQNHQISLIGGSVFGIVDKKCQMVTLEKLMSNAFIKFDEQKIHAIFIPADEILKRTKYQWFVRLSQNQLRKCNNSIAKHLVVALG